MRGSLVARLTAAGLTAGLLATAALANALALAAYAIAFNTSNGKAAASNGSFDLEAAGRVGLDTCGRGCRIVASGKRSCAAVVESISTGTGQWAVATGTNHVLSTFRGQTGILVAVHSVLRESLLFGNISVPGPDRMDNLLKVHS